MNIKNAVTITILVMASLISVAILGFSFYRLSRDTEALYVSMVSSIVGMWLGIASSYMKKITDSQSSETSDENAV